MGSRRDGLSSASVLGSPMSNNLFNDYIPELSLCELTEPCLVTEEIQFVLSSRARESWLDAGTEMVENPPDIS